MLKLLMAVSLDGYMARGVDDDMAWTGQTDKRIFRILTGVGGQVGVSARSGLHMPRLPCREVTVLSTVGVTVEEYARAHPVAWLVGGPTLAAHALLRGLLEEVHLVRVSRCANPESGQGIGDTVSHIIEERYFRGYQWEHALTTCLDVAQVETWRRH